MKRTAIALLSVATLLGAAACSGGAPETSGDEPVQLVYWSWAPEIESIVDIWNEQNPDIQVDVSTAAGFGEFTAKLLAAYEAGNAPDVNNTNYQNLPLLITSGVAADITDAMDPLRDDFSPVALDMVDFDGTIYGVPQATTPNLLIYREDRFAELGLPVPKTWEEFADVARQVRERDPDTYLFNFDPANFGFFHAMAQQNATQGWSLQDGVWGVQLDSPEAREVAAFWGTLVEEDLVSTQQGGSPELNAAVAAGEVLSVVDSVWAPVSIAGYAPDTAGSWQVVPVPQWNAAAPVSGVLGGSATMVSSQTEYPEEAAEFAIWLNHSMDSLEAYVAKVSIFPAMLEARSLPELQTPPALVSNVPDFFAIAAEVDTYSEPVVWGPNVTTASESFASAFGAATQRGDTAQGYPDALAQVQDAVVSDMSARGFDMSTD